MYGLGPPGLCKEAGNCEKLARYDMFGADTFTLLLIRAICELTYSSTSSSKAARLTYAP